MSTADVRKLCHRLASGLSAVHEAGAVHRDLSPDNIILPGGKVERAKIIDFGIARSATIGGETLIGGSFAGKYNYVSPEQLGLYGGDVREASDIYSLGLVLAAAMRGSPIDMGGSQFEVVEKRRTVPDLSGIDDDFRPMIEAMLQPDPADRPASMAEIARMTRDDPLGYVGTATAAAPRASTVWTRADRVALRPGFGRDFRSRRRGDDRINRPLGAVSDEPRFRSIHSAGASVAATSRGRRNRSRRRASVKSRARNIALAAAAAVIVAARCGRLSRRFSDASGADLNDRQRRGDPTSDSTWRSEQESCRHLALANRPPQIQRRLPRKPWRPPSLP